MVDPTMLCVPEIGSFKKVATSNHIALLANDDKQPSINSTSEFSYMDTSKIPLRIVLDTLYPINTDPAISQKVASQHACLMVNTPDPTLVPNELATSFALEWFDVGCKFC